MRKHCENVLTVRVAQGLGDFSCKPDVLPKVVEHGKRSSKALILVSVVSVQRQDSIADVVRNEDQPHASKTEEEIREGN